MGSPPGIMPSHPVSPSVYHIFSQRQSNLMRLAITTMHKDFSKHSPVKVHVRLNNLKHNYTVLAEACATPVMPVLKADAYGHGLIPCARAMLEVGAPALAVGIVNEGIFLREQGLTCPILSLFGPLDSEQAAQAVAGDIISLAADMEQLNMLAAQASPDKPAKVALKFDTGMARLGFGQGDVPGLIAALRNMPAVRPVMVLSHFAVADEIDGVDFTAGQIATFKDITAAVKSQWPGVKASLANSAGGLAFPEARLDIVRDGISLYGSNPFQGTDQEHLGQALKPVMEISTSLVQVHPLRPGQSISYGRTFTAQRAMLAGIVACGYANGYSRRLSNRAAMVVRGMRAPVLGRVCMQLTAVDLSHIPEARAGDMVWILGGPASCAVRDWELAAWQESITHEVFCCMGDLNSQEY